MEIGDRLKQIRLSFQESQTVFAARYGLAQTTYAPYETGKRAIPDDLKVKLAQDGFDMNWLLTGNGSMKSQEVESKEVKTVSMPNYFIATKKSFVAEIIPDGGLSVPIITQKLSAGPGQPWTQADIIDGERLPILSRFIKPWNKDRVFAAEVRGDSMTGIQLFDGDMAIFVRGEVEGDGIYVITVDDEVYVKRVAFNPFDRKVTIKSENDRYDPITVDADRIILVGKVIGWLHHHPY